MQTNKPGVFESRIDVNKIKFQFKKNLSRKEVEHMNALQRAQVFIDTTQERKNEQDKGKKNADEVLEMRPATPIYKPNEMRKDPRVL